MAVLLLAEMAENGLNRDATAKAVTAVAPLAATEGATRVPAAKVGGSGPNVVSTADVGSVTARTAAMRCPFCQDRSVPPTRYQRSSLSTRPHGSTVRSAGA